MTSNVGQTDVGASREARDQMDASLWWRPQPGEGKLWGSNFLRVLPPHKNMEGKFYFGIPLHFDVGPTKAVVPCLRQGHGLPCPLCIAGFALRDQGKDEEGNRLLPSWIGYMNVVLLDENGVPAGKDPAVRVFSANRKILDDLLEIMEQKYGDITHLETGRNINIERKGLKFKTQWRVSAATEESAFDYPDLVGTLHDLGTLSPYRPAEVLAGLLEAPAGRKDPFAGAPAEDKPAISGPVQQPGGMKFESPPDDDSDAAQDQMRAADAEADKQPAPTQEEAQAALRKQIGEGS